MTMMMDMVPVAPSMTAVVTPAASREETTTITNNVWLDRLLRGDRLTESEWQLLGTQEKSHAALLTSSTTSTASAAGSDAVRPSMVVRFTGMVQDMLDAEYFPIAADTATNNGGNLQLAERTPLAIVPFEQLLQYSENNNNTLSAVAAAGSAQQQEEHRNKRAKLADEDAIMDCDDEDNNNNNNNNNSSKPLDCALAKFYYDQYPESSNQQLQRLRLNQMVEVVGVLEESPQLLDSSTANINHHQNNNNSNNDTPQSTDSSDAMFWQRSMDDHDVPSVPAVVPRLHVLWYQPVSHLEDLKQDAAPDTSANTDPAAVSTTTTLLAQLTGVDPITAQTLAMLLQSQAERSDDKASNPIITPQETVLGCASLQVQLPTDAVDCLAQRLTLALSQLVPLVRLVDLSSQQPEKQQQKSVAAPCKRAGRLQQTDLQLPAGSVVLVKCSQPPSSLTQEQRETLQQLCQGHRLQYAFDGGVRIPFEADYRVLVLSSASENPFGCSLQVRCSSLQPALGAPDGTQMAAVRASLAAARRLGNVGVSHSVLDKAQHDFLKRRAADRRNVGELEFHRWLTLTRLHARGNARPFATEEDWEAALRLDDSMRASLVP